VQLGTFGPPSPVLPSRRHGRLTFGHFCTNTLVVRGAEFIRKLQKIGRAHGLAVRVVASRGKGSHATLYLGTAFTTIKDRKKEIGPGLLKAMLKDLGLTEGDLK
jgi:mRNA interferase HicA